MLIIKKVIPKEAPSNFYRRQYLCKIECGAKNTVTSEDSNENCDKDCNERDISIHSARYFSESNNNYDASNIASMWHDKYNNVVDLDSHENTNDDFYIDNG